MQTFYPEEDTFFVFDDGRYAFVPEGMAICMADGVAVEEFTDISAGVAKVREIDPEFTFDYQPVVVPEVVTMRQARSALLAAGLLDQIPAVIAAIEDEGVRRQAEIDWEYAGEVRRDWPLVEAVCGALGLNASGIDALFVSAGKI